jgi:hypothetical protein
MGTEAAWVPLVVAALGSGVQAYNVRQTAKEADNVAAQGIRQQGERQREADDRVSQEVNALEASSPEAARAQATEAFMGQLRRTRGNAVENGPAGASARYGADLAGAEGDVADFGSRGADILARIGAPAQQRLAEGQGAGRLASDLGGIGRNAGGDAFLNNLRQRSVRNNPWLEAGGQILTGVGSGMAANQGRYGNPTKGGTRTDVPVRRQTPGFA